jgi:hypothetical protein
MERVYGIGRRGGNLSASQPGMLLKKMTPR